MTDAPAAGHESLVRRLGWLLALLPLLAAAAWASFGARLPEPVAERQRLGEATMQWNFEDLVEVPVEPMHVGARAAFLGVLQVPGATFRWTVAANAFAAAMIVLCLALATRRAFGFSGTATQFAFGLAGLLVCSPAFGADWLHGERIGLFLVPLLLLLGLLSLQGERSFALRAIFALLLVITAPFCHVNGVVAFAVAVPMLWHSARRAGTSGLAWAGAATLLGAGAAAISLWPAGGPGGVASGISGSAFTAPFATALHLLRTTGAAWLDPLPATTLDELVLGGACWLLPLLLWGSGDRGDEARGRAAPWWGCIWFGLLLSALQAERFGPDVQAAVVRELGLGSFLLPVGCIGLVAARFGFLALPVGGGILLVLSLQDWSRGIGELRLARMRVERTETSLLLPPDVAIERAPLPTRDAEELQLLRDRCWVPPGDATFAEALRTIDTAAPVDGVGSCDGGDANTVHGAARSSLTGESVQCVVVRVTTGDSVAFTAGWALPDWETRSRNAPWSVALAEPVAEGSHVRAFGYLLRRHVFTPLGPPLVLRDGALVPEQ